MERVLFATSVVLLTILLGATALWLRHIRAKLPRSRLRLRPHRQPKPQPRPQVLDGFPVWDLSPTNDKVIGLVSSADTTSGNYYI